MPAASDRMMFPHAGCAGVEAKVVGRHSGLSVPGDDGISPICSTSRNASPLSVFMYALSREYGSQNINGHTRGIAGRRTLIKRDRLRQVLRISPMLANQRATSQYRNATFHCVPCLSRLGVVSIMLWFGGVQFAGGFRA